MNEQQGLKRAFDVQDSMNRVQSSLLEAIEHIHKSFFDSINRKEFFRLLNMSSSPESE